MWVHAYRGLRPAWIGQPVERLFPPLRCVALVLELLAQEHAKYYVYNMFCR